MATVETGSVDSASDEVTAEHDLAAHLAQLPQDAVLYVYVKQPDRAEVQISLHRASTTIGRSASCDVVLQSPHVSHMHAEILRDAAGVWRLRDLGSRAGVMHDRNKVTAMVLQPGDAFYLADVRVRIEAAVATGS